MYFDLISPYANVADVNNGRRLNPSHRCCIESFLSMVEFESQSLWECRNFTNPLSNGQGSVGQCHALLPVTWRCHPLYFFYFPYTMASLVYIWEQQAGHRRGAYKMQNHYYYKAHKSDFSLSERRERFPPSKTAIEMMNERSNLHEIAFLPNLFCICTEIMQAFASKSSLGTGYESYSRCNGYKLSLISSGFLTKKSFFLISDHTCMPMSLNAQT